MTAPLIAPVIPPDRSARGGLRRARATAPPQLADPPLRLAPSELSCGIGRMDASGRVADRSVMAALGWGTGDRLTLTAESGVVVARRDPSGMVTLAPRPYLVISALLRRRCRLRAGDLLLMAASRDAVDRS